MAFVQFKLDVATTQTRGIFNTYVYQTETDTVADVQAAGYFERSRFDLVDEDGCGALIRCCCSDGFFEGFVGADGTIDPIDNVSSPIWPAFVAVDDTDSPVTVTGEIGCYTADCTNGDVTFILPAALNGNFVFKKNDASNNIVIVDAGTNGNTIDGLATRTLTSQYASYTVNRNGIEWVRQ